MLQRVAEWYLARPRPAVPFYCDPDRVGAFAVSPGKLAAGEDAAVFRLFITLAMYQALRDEVIMRQQRSLAATAVRSVVDLDFLRRSITRHMCPAFLEGERFEQACDVWKREGAIDCKRCPGIPCHVKEATSVFNRFGDMGKLPTSAILRVWNNAGLAVLRRTVSDNEDSPTRRALALVELFSRVHRVGNKLATLFVSTLTTPALEPGLSPWFPDVNGNELVVVDTNVARAVDRLRKRSAPRTYAARAAWVRHQAGFIDLSKLRADVPAFSPRLLQEALYAFCSKSNRVAGRDPCAGRQTSCAQCAVEICPFSTPR